MNAIRPAGIKIILVSHFLVITWNIVRVAAAAYYWRVLSDYADKGEVFYILFTGLIPIVVSMTIGWATWMHKRWAWKGNLGFALGYSAWILFDWLVIGQGRENLIFISIISSFLLVILLFLLFSSKVRNFFHE